MYSDISGYLPQWLKTTSLIVGAVLVVAAITILTCGVGTATLAGAIAVGASQGALIGAAVGIVGGGAIGYAINGTEGMIEGAMLGFGIGSLAGAVIGGSLAYSSFVPQNITGYTRHGLEQAMTRNGHGVSPQGVLDAVRNPVQEVVKQANGGYKYIGQNSVTILNKAGKVITTWSKSIFWRF